MKHKKALGRAASYGRIAQRVSVGKTTVQLVLKDDHSNDLPIDRRGVLEEIEAALHEIDPSAA